jgi:hypothetical protein
MAMTSSRSFIEFLNERRPEEEKILLALRFYLSESTEDKLPREMLGEIAESVGSASQLDAAVDELGKDPSAQVSIALELLAERWALPAEREKIERAFAAAATKLPVIEAALITVVSMYAMFLIANGGLRRRKRKIVRRQDGTFEDTIEEEFFSPLGPLQTVVSLFAAKVKPQTADADEP